MKTTQENKQDMKIYVSIRLPQREKVYYLAQLQEFANTFNKSKVKSISFGKQDLRGAVSITFFDFNHCVPMQKFFYNKYELLGFVCGFNANKFITTPHDIFNRFI